MINAKGYICVETILSWQTPGYRVPQDSILGRSSLNMYVNDTTLYTAAKTLEQTIHRNTSHRCAVYCGVVQAEPAYYQSEEDTFQAIPTVALIQPHTDYIQ